jgi:alpha 1,6-mannosyltransferase
LADGGVYSDVDTKALKPVARWIPEQHITSVNTVLGIEIDEPGDMWVDWADNFAFCQSTMMAKPGHKLFEIVVQNVLSRIAMLAQEQGKSIHQMKFSFRDVLRVSGPVAFSDSVFQYLSIATKTEITRQNLTELKEGVQIADIFILPVNAFVPGQAHSNSGSPEDATALVQHLGMGSWRNNHDLDN